MLTHLAMNKYFRFLANLPFTRMLFEKISQRELGVDIEWTGFSGTLTVRYPSHSNRRDRHTQVSICVSGEYSSTTE